jgi:hypothetical protein
VEDLGENRFNARTLVEGIMDSSFDTNPEEWAEIVKIDKKLEELQILVPHEGAGYSAPHLDDLKKAAAHLGKASGAPEKTQNELSRFSVSLDSMKLWMKDLTMAEEHRALRDHVAQINSIVDSFEKGIKSIREALEKEDWPRIEGEIAAIEESANIKPPTKDEAAAKKKQATTLFKVNKAGTEVPRAFTSPCYDRIQNALAEFREETIDEAQLMGVINEVLEQMVAFQEFCTTELEWLSESDPESYGLFRDVMSVFVRSQKLCKEGSEQLLMYFGDKNDEHLTRGMETFSRGIQEIVAVYMLLDNLRRHGL